MSKTEALKLALEALEIGSGHPTPWWVQEKQSAAITAIREVLAEQTAKCKHNVFAPYRCTQCEAEQPAQEDPKKALMWSTVAMQERHEQRIQKTVATLERIKQEQLAEQQEPSPTAGMNIAQRILHVGGRNNAAGYVEFGSIQAVEALVRQVLRDLPAQAPAWPKHKPETSLHEIVLDGVYRGFLNDQIIEETCGLATHKMLNFYRYAIDLEMGLQEPVAILNHAHGVHAIRSVKLNGLPDGEYRLYTSPQPASKPWVRLSEEDRLDIWKHSSSIDGAIKATEAKLREKNT